MHKSLANRIRRIDIVLKLAERCNLACPYCYYYFQEFNANNNQPLISADVVEALPQFFSRTAKETGVNAFNISLHGGEPLLIKKKRFDSILKYVKENTPKHIDLQFSIQTNGVLIDDEWVDLFSKHQVAVGISLDGTPSTHGKMRPKHNGESSYNDAERGLKLVQQAYQDGKLKKVGVLTLMHPEDGEQVLKHIVKKLGVSSPGLNFPRGGWDSQDSPKWILHVDKHREVIRYWMDELVFPQFHYIRGISDLFFSMQSEDAAQYNDISNSLRQHVVTISSEGKILVDDNMFGLGDEFFNSDLNIFEHSLRDHFTSPLFQELIAANDHKPPACEGCQWYRLCKAGPLYNRFSKVNRFNNKAVICEVLKMIYEELAMFSLEVKTITETDLESVLNAPMSITSKEIYRSLIENHENLRSIET